MLCVSVPLTLTTSPGMANWQRVRHPLRIMTGSLLWANMPFSSVARIFFFIFTLMLSRTSLFTT